MTNLTILPADLAAMSVSDLTSLPLAQKQESSRNLDEALD